MPRTLPNQANGSGATNRNARKRGSGRRKPLVSDAGLWTGARCSTTTARQLIGYPRCSSGEDHLDVAGGGLPVERTSVGVFQAWREEPVFCIHNTQIDFTTEL